MQGSGQTWGNHFEMAHKTSWRKARIYRYGKVVYAGKLLRRREEVPLGKYKGYFFFEKIQIVLRFQKVTTSCAAFSQGAAEMISITGPTPA